MVSLGKALGCTFFLNNEENYPLPSILCPCLCLGPFDRHQPFYSHWEAAVTTTPAINCRLFNYLLVYEITDGSEANAPVPPPPLPTENNHFKAQVVLTAPQVITCLHCLLICDESARTVISDKYEIMRWKQSITIQRKINKGNVSRLYNEPVSPHSKPPALNLHLQCLVFI